MKIKTTRFGEICIDKEKIIRMPYGMLGFPDKYQWIMFQHKADSPFYWYQSVDDPKLAFVVTSPIYFVSDYDVDTDHILEEMSWGCPSKAHLELYVVVNIPKGSPEKMTINLIGPILINNEARQAVQMVISNSPYSHQHAQAEIQ